MARSSSGNGIIAPHIAIGILQLFIVPYRSQHIQCLLDGSRAPRRLGEFGHIFGDRRGGVQLAFRDEQGGGKACERFGDGLQRVGLVRLDAGCVSFENNAAIWRFGPSASLSFVN